MTTPIQCCTCEGPMAWRGTQVRYEGDYELVTVRYECQFGACQTSAEVAYRRFIPLDIAEQESA